MLNNSSQFATNESVSPLSPESKGNMETKPTAHERAYRSPRALNLKEAAECLNVSEKSVRRWIGRGLMRKCGVTRKILIPIEDVEKFFQKHSQVEWQV